MDHDGLQLLAVNVNHGVTRAKISHYTRKHAALISYKDLNSLAPQKVAHLCQVAIAEA